MFQTCGRLCVCSTECKRLKRPLLYHVDKEKNCGKRVGQRMSELDITHNPHFFSLLSFSTMGCNQSHHHPSSSREANNSPPQANTKATTVIQGGARGENVNAAPLSLLQSRIPFPGTHKQHGKQRNEYQGGAGEENEHKV